MSPNALATKARPQCPKRYSKLRRYPSAKWVALPVLTWVAFQAIVTEGFMVSRLASLMIFACATAFPTPGHAEARRKSRWPITEVADTGPVNQPMPAGAGGTQPSTASGINAETAADAGKAICASANGSEVSLSGSTNKPDCVPPLTPGAQTGTSTDTGKTPGDRGTASLGAAR